MRLRPLQLLASLAALLLTASLSVAAAGISAVGDGSAALEWISRPFDGGQPLQESWNRQAAVSGNGRYVAFVTDAVNWPGGGKATENVYRKDLLRGDLRLISQTSNGVPADRFSEGTAISADGNLVVFSSLAENLWPGVFHGWELYLRNVATGVTEPISVSDDGDPSLSFNGAPVMDPTGRYIAWMSDSLDLTPGVTSRNFEIYLRDRQAGTTRRVSVPNGGGESNGRSSHASISKDGRYIAFLSDASNLVPGDTNQSPDAFIRDTVANTTTRVSLGQGGVELNGGCYALSLSGDGKRIGFVTWASNVLAEPSQWQQAYVRDLQTGAIVMAGVSDTGEPVGGISAISLNDNGALAAFDTFSDNVVAGDDNGTSDCFLRDLNVGATLHLSRSATPGEGRQESMLPVINGSGSRIVFTSRNAALAAGGNHGLNLYAMAGVGGPITLVSANSAGVTGDAPGASSEPQISADGRFVAFASQARNLVPGDTNGAQDVFVRDRLTGELTRESRTESGSQAPFGGSHPTLSGEGEYLAWTGFAPGPSRGLSPESRVFLRNRADGAVRQLVRTWDGKLPNHSTFDPSIDDLGTRVAFTSYATNLTPGEVENGLPDVYWCNVSDAAIGLASKPVSGRSGNGSSQDPEISADGRRIVFSSTASNLIAGDTNAAQDILLREVSAAKTTRVSVASNGLQANGHSRYPSIGTGSVAFESDASNLVPGDTNGYTDVFVRHSTPQTERVSLLTAGGQVPAGGFEPVINSADEIVAFTSGAWEFLPDEPAGIRVYAHNLPLRATYPASLPKGSSEPYPEDYQADLEGTGRYLAFVSDRIQSAAGDLRSNADIYVRDRWNFPAAPVILVVARGLKERSLDVRWEYSPETETGFEIERRIGNGPWLPLRSVDTATRVLHDGDLAYNTLYSYRIRAVNTRYASPFSDEVSAISELEPPSEFGAGVSADGRTIGLTWKFEGGGIDGFHLQQQVGDEPFGPPVPIGRIVRSHSISGVEPETLYTFRLSTYRGGADSRPAVTSIRTPKDPPPPRGLQAEVLGRIIVLRWGTLGSSLIDGTYVERRKAEGIFVRFATVAAELDAYWDMELEVDTEYTYRLRFFRGNLVSDPSEVISARTDGPPPAPAGLTAAYKKGAMLRWDPVPNGKDVDITIFRKTDSGTYRELFQVWGIDTEFTDLKVESGHTYTYRLRAANDLGDSPFSNEATVNIPNLAPLAHAGPDQTVKTRARKAQVKLDASASSDPEGKTLTYTWSENKAQIATGATPAVKLKPGIHTLTLTVRDPEKATAADQVTITVKRKR